MQRASTFLIGGGIAISLGVLLAAGLVWSGAGTEFLSGWLAAAFSVLLGAFFVHVSREERRFRSEYLRAVEEGRSPPPGGPPV
jgi:hypothetical protein